MSMKLGAMLLVLGVGGFVLPFLGLQFKILNLFGSAQYIIAGLLAIVGMVIMAAGALAKKSPEIKKEV